MSVSLYNLFSSYQCNTPPPPSLPTSPPLPSCVVLCVHGISGGVIMKGMPKQFSCLCQITSCAFLHPLQYIPVQWTAVLVHLQMLMEHTLVEDDICIHTIEQMLG